MNDFFFCLHQKFKLYPCYMFPISAVTPTKYAVYNMAFYSSHDLLSPFASGKSESERARQDQELSIRIPGPEFWCRGPEAAFCRRG